MTDWLYAYSDAQSTVELLRSRVDVLERISGIYQTSLEEIASIPDRNIDDNVSKMKGIAKAAIDSAKAVADSRGIS